jgi:hypothetical protein
VKPVTRRRFLVLGGAAAALATSTVASLGWLRGAVPDVAGLKVLSAQQYHTLATVARTHIPRGGAFPEGAEDFDLARLFDGYLADQPAADQRDAGLALHLIEFGPVLFDGHAATFSHLTPDEQLVHWSAWGTATQQTRREIFWSFSRFLGLTFYDQEAIWPHIDYAGPSFARLARKAAEHG